MPDIRTVSQAELDRQTKIMRLLSERNAALPERPLAFVDTYGCQQNEADSEKLRGMLALMGYGFTSSEAEADLIEINTCAVREHAEMRVLGNVGALTHTKRAKPGQKIALCGCMVQQPHRLEKLKLSYTHVDLIFGPHELWRFPELLYSTLSPHKGRIVEARQIDGELYEGLPMLRSGKVRAWITVMNGCDNFCSYCVVPFVRGRERSRSPEAVIKEAREAVEAGYKELYLLGQNVNSYGKDLNIGADFSYLLEEINRIDGDFIIRFMTAIRGRLRPSFETMARCEKVERHIHLPFQSGNDRVLMEMNRGYTAAITIAHGKGPLANAGHSPNQRREVGFSTERTRIRRHPQSGRASPLRHALHVHIFASRRHRGGHDERPFQPQDKQRRFDRLIELQNRISVEPSPPMWEKAQDTDRRRGDSEGRLTARTLCGRLVHVEGGPELIGSFAFAEITGFNTYSLTGRLL